MRSISRRGFLTTSGVALGALPWVRSIGSLAQITNPVFRHGVASGDPDHHSAVFWTRVTPSDPSAGEIPVVLEVAKDAGFTDMVRRTADLTARA